MKILYSKNGKKVIEIPPIRADNCATDFKYLHGKNLYDLDENEDLYDIKVGKGKSGIDYLIIIYQEVVRPNVIFKFSKPLSEKMEYGCDKKYLLNCQFFYWEDETGKSHIRFARPIEFDEESIIFE